MKVVVATYEDRHGFTETRVFGAPEGAWKWRQEIAAERWSRDVDDDEPKPEDPEELADAYFDIVADHGPWLNSEELEVEGEMVLA